MSPKTSSPPPPPEKYVLFMFLCSTKHQTATGTLFTITTDYNFRKLLGLPCFQLMLKLPCDNIT